MPKTENLGLTIINDDQTTFKEFRESINGDREDSVVNILDREVIPKSQIIKEIGPSRTSKITRDDLKQIILQVDFDGQVIVRNFGVHKVVYESSTNIFMKYTNNLSSNTLIKETFILSNLGQMLRDTDPEDPKWEKLEQSNEIINVDKLIDVEFTRESLYDNEVIYNIFSNEIFKSNKTYIILTDVSRYFIVESIYNADNTYSFKISYFINGNPNEGFVLTNWNDITNTKDVIPNWTRPVYQTNIVKRVLDMNPPFSTPSVGTLLTLKSKVDFEGQIVYVEKTSGSLTHRTTYDSSINRFTFSQSNKPNELRILMNFNIDETTLQNELQWSIVSPEIEIITRDIQFDNSIVLSYNLFQNLEVGKTRLVRYIDTRNQYLVVKHSSDYCDVTFISEQPVKKLTNLKEFMRQDLGDDIEAVWKTPAYMEDIQSGGGGEVDLNAMAYFNYAGSIYGDKYDLLPSAWEHSLTVVPLEISEESKRDSPRGKAQYPNGETEGVIIPNSVTSIGANAFSSWISNNQPLIIPNSVTSIGTNVFRSWRSNNKPLVIPNSVTSIGDSAFNGWTSNNQPLIIPNSVTSIGANAFNGWALVPYVEIQAITPPTLLRINAFSGQNDAPIYVPDESIDDYKTATNWVDLADRIFPISMIMVRN